MEKLVLLFFFSPLFLFSQPIDSTIHHRIDGLITNVIRLELEGKFQEMLDSATLAGTISVEHFGERSEQHADCLQWQGAANIHFGYFSVADSLLALTGELFAEALGKESEKYANSLYPTISSLLYQGRVREGIGKAKEAVTLTEKIYGKMHGYHAKCVEVLGAAYVLSGQLDLAEPLLLESQRIGVALNGTETVDNGITYTHLAMLYMDLGRYEEAEPAFKEVIRIYEKTLGDQHPYYAYALDNISDFYSQTGRYKKAAFYLNSSQAIIEKKFGDEHHAYGIGLSNLATVDIELGELERAEERYLAALSITEKSKGKNNVDYSSMLNSIAQVYANLGRYAEAEKSLLEALDITEAVLGKAHTNYPFVQTQLANIYQATQRFEKANALYSSAQSIQEKILGTSHKEYALTLYYWGDLYLRQKKYAKAEGLFLQVQQIYEQSIGKEHLRYASNLRSLAKVLAATDRTEEARSLLLETQRIQEKILGEQDFSLSKTLEELAKLYANQQAYKEAAAYFIRYNQINQALQLQRATYFSNTELQAYQSLFQEANHLLRSFGASHSALNISSSIYDNTLFHKGFLLENVIIRERLITEAPAAIREKHAQWKGYLRRLAKEYGKPISERATLVQSLEENANRLERELVQSIAGFGPTRQSITWQTVQSQLPAKSAAIEFIHYAHPDALLGDSILYAALLLRFDKTNPQFIPLFEEQELQILLAEKDASQPDFLNQLYRATSSTPNALHQLLWSALEKKLTGLETLYFSPSGLLHRLHLGAIAINEKETIADRFQLVQLGSTRQLATSRREVSSQNEAMLFGDINYELDTTKRLAQTEQANLFRSRGAFLSPRGDAWNPLNWTAVEVKSVGGILQDHDFAVNLQNQHGANEETFKAIGKTKASPRVLHLATHGYFFPDASRREVKGSTTVFQTSEHPMIRSGLILAGANPVWEGREAVEGREDGILTAYEISQMDLSNTELVVLSACDTGLGDIEGNEGVYGLQRAFKVAGAKYLIMSLWQVPDFQTQELMYSFYLEWLEEEKSIPEAFRAAQAQMRQRYPEPFNWAGFILVE